MTRRAASVCIAVTAITLVLGACSSTAPASSSGPSSSSAVLADPTATQEPRSTPTAAAEASPSPSMAMSAVLARDSIAVTTAEDLRVRQDPDLASDQVSSLSVGTRVFVLSGPKPDPADPAIDWWEVMPIQCEDGCTSVRLGWVSSGPGKDWLRPVVHDCPRSFKSVERPTFDPVELLACHGSEPILMEGVLDYWCCRGITFGVTEPEWLAGSHSNPFRPVLRVSADIAASWGPELVVNPASGITLPERGTVARISGHFDDPVAHECVTTVSDEEKELNPDLLWSTTPQYSIFGCRLQVVVDSIEVLDFIPLPTHPPQG